MYVYKIRHKQTGEFMGHVSHTKGKKKKENMRGKIPWVRDGGRLFTHTKFIRQFFQRTQAPISYDNIEIIEYALLENRVLSPRSYR